MRRRNLASALPLLVLLGCRTAAPPAAPQPPPQDAAPQAPQEAASQPPQEAASQPPAAEGSAERYENTLRWSTASEVENFGYDVYRATAADGPFERITSDPVAGGGTTDVPQFYTYVDSAIDPHQAYYYYVESISFSGERERFTPVIMAKPKLPPDGSSSPP